MRIIRCHNGACGEIRTLPRTSDGQKGAVAVRGRVNMNVTVANATPPVEEGVTGPLDQALMNANRSALNCS